MGEDRKMQNWLRGEMMELDSPMLEKSMEKIRSLDGKAALNKIVEKNDFVRTFIRLVFALRASPLDDGVGLKKAFVNQIGYSKF